VLSCAFNESATGDAVDTPRTSASAPPTSTDRPPSVIETRSSVLEETDGRARSTDPALLSCQLTAPFYQQPLPVVPATAAGNFNQRAMWINGKPNRFLFTIADIRN